MAVGLFFKEARATLGKMYHGLLKVSYETYYIFPNFSLDPKIVNKSIFKL